MVWYMVCPNPVLERKIQYVNSYQPVNPSTCFSVNPSTRQPVNQDLGCPSRNASLIPVSTCHQLVSTRINLSPTHLYQYLDHLQYQHLYQYLDKHQYQHQHHYQPFMLMQCNTIFTSKRQSRIWILGYGHIP